jgi:hypothetical protein
MAVCGARRRNGELCQKPPLKGKTRCRLHGGASKPKPAPKGNDYAKKHNIYSQFMSPEEIEFSLQSELDSVDSELRLTKVQLARALKAKQAQDEKIKDQDKLELESMVLGDAAEDENGFGGDKLTYKKIDFDSKIDKIIARISSLTKLRNDLLSQVLTNEKLELEIAKLKIEANPPKNEGVQINIVRVGKKDAD